MTTEGFGRALIVASDLKGYGGGTDRRHELMQAEFVAIHRQAAEAAGLSRDEWVTQEGGDGELAILPATASDPQVVDGYMRALAAAVQRRNEGLAPGERLRLRVAVAFGTAYRAANGYAGQAVVVANRLISAESIKRIFDEKAEANLILILSQRVFDDVVRQEHTSYRPDDFVEVNIQKKEFEGSAWVWVPGADIRDLTFLTAPGKNDAPPPQPQPGAATFSQHAEAITTITAPVDARGAVFGISRR